MKDIFSVDSMRKYNSIVRGRILHSEPISLTAQAKLVACGDHIGSHYLLERRLAT